MRNIDLKLALEIVSEASENILKAKERITPTYFIGTTDADGKKSMCVLPAPHASKAVNVEFLKQILALLDADYYVFVDEAWEVETHGKTEEEMKAAGAPRPSEHPDRIEVIMLIAEDNEQTLLARRKILRGKGKPKLGPLRWISDEYGKNRGALGGQLVGLMPTDNETEH
jgi:hypothetical protein